MFLKKLESCLILTCFGGLKVLIFMYETKHLWQYDIQFGLGMELGICTRPTARFPPAATQRAASAAGKSCRLC